MFWTCIFFLKRPHIRKKQLYLQNNLPIISIMAYQEVKTTGYGTRVKNSFGGIIPSFILFFAATALLWWNEGRAVKTTKMLNETEKVCVDMENPNKKDPSLEGEVVCATALATTEDSLIDKQFNLGAKAISLQRTVEYYQWVEHTESESKDKFGGKEETTYTYTYTKEWMPRPVDSGSFKDPAYQGKNRVVANFEDAEQWAENVSFGAYTLNESLIHSITSREPFTLDLDQKQLADYDKSVAKAYGKDKVAQPAPSQPALQNDTNNVATPQENQVDLEFVHQNGNVLYFGQSAASPEIGDVRITFEKIVPAKVTIIAQVTGDTFKSYKAKNGKRFQTLVMGKKDADEIFDSQRSSNKMWLWIFRLIGVLLVISALKGIFGFLSTLLKVIPFLANIIGWGIGVVCTVVGVAWSLIVIALAWLFYRPLLSIVLLAVAGFLTWVFAFKGKEKLIAMAKKNKQTPAPEIK